MSRSQPTRGDYRHFRTFTTRWWDNEIYGHVNNAVYFEYVDTLVNGWLLGSGGLDVPNGPVICLVVETGAQFHASLGFPGSIEAGLGLDRLGRSSIGYAVGLFAPGADSPAATARFVHVCIDRVTRRPVLLPDALRRALRELTP